MLRTPSRRRSLKIRTDLPFYFMLHSHERAAFDPCFLMILDRHRTCRLDGI